MAITNTNTERSMHGGVAQYGTITPFDKKVEPPGTSLGSCGLCAAPFVP